MIQIDQVTGEVHWDVSEYEGLLKKIKDLELEIHRLKQMIK
jgi:hypothetical protein